MVEIRVVSLTTYDSQALQVPLAWLQERFQPEAGTHEPPKHSVRQLAACSCASIVLILYAVLARSPGCAEYAKRPLPNNHPVRGTSGNSTLG